MRVVRLYLYGNKYPININIIYIYIYIYIYIFNKCYYLNPSLILMNVIDDKC